VLDGARPQASPGPPPRLPSSNGPGSRAGAFLSAVRNESEAGGPSVTPPSRKGFGTVVLERMDSGRIGDAQVPDHGLGLAHGSTRRLIDDCPGSQFRRWLTPFGRPLSRSRLGTLIRDV
jgi:hypothetical protein